MSNPSKDFHLIILQVNIRQWQESIRKKTNELTPDVIGDDSILHEEEEVEEEINENYDEIVEEEKEISQPNIQDTEADQEKRVKLKSNYLI